MYNMTVYFSICTRSISLFSLKQALKCLVNIWNIKKPLNIFFNRNKSPFSNILHLESWVIKTFQLLLEKNMLTDFLKTEMWYDFETQSYSQTNNVPG